MADFTGKRGLVLGVANKRSLAWSIASALSGAGARIALTYQGDRLKDRVEPLAAELGPGTPLHECDVTRDGDVEDLSGNGRTARLVGGKRGPGKLGGGLVCAGNQDRAEVAPDLAPSMKGDYTVALWFRKAVEAEVASSTSSRQP